MMTFQNLGLTPDLVQTVSGLGYEAPTPIQEGTIPLLLSGRDVLGQAQTGTGKTAAFALPMINALDPDVDGIQGLVVTPTRELANQVATAIYSYGKDRRVRVLSVYGGQPYGRQIDRLKRGVDIVVGTPGRMLDLIRQGELDLSSVRFLVLDEADEMLSMGFIEDIESILSLTPVDRQTALFSATLPRPIRDLAARYMHTPQAVSVSPEHLTVDQTEQRYYLVHEADKLPALARLLEIEGVTSAMIFTRTRAGADDLTEALLARGFQAEALHGDLTQQARETVLGRFRRGQLTLLVATDVAARGLDIEDVSHVFNYDLPMDAEYYIHRIGRTGRAGKTGVAISLVTPGERWRIGRIEALTRRPIAQTRLPSAVQVQVHRDERFMEALADEMAAAEPGREHALAARLAEAGYDPLQIAAAAMRLARANEQQRPIEDIAEVQTPSRMRHHESPGRQDSGGRGYGRAATSRPDGRERPASAPRASRSHASQRGQEAGMVRLALNAGEAQGIRPAEIVGAIAGTADIPGKSIGAISIREHETLVDVAEQHAELVLRKMKGWKLRGQAVTLQRAK